jgi:hypothetical protein
MSEKWLQRRSTRTRVVSVDRTKSPASTVDARVKNEPRHQHPFRARAVETTGPHLPHLPQPASARCALRREQRLTVQPGGRARSIRPRPVSDVGSVSDTACLAATEEQQSGGLSGDDQSWLSVCGPTASPDRQSSAVQFRAPQWTSRTNRRRVENKKKKKKRSRQGLPTSF